MLLTAFWTIGHDMSVNLPVVILSRIGNPTAEIETPEDDRGPAAWAFPLIDRRLRMLRC